jgi:cation:H+ antiporter
MDWVLLGIPVGIVMLYFGSEWLVDGAKKLAIRLGVTPFVVGLTVVAFGSSSPECITSIVSRANPEIIVGNIVGSNIANVGLCIGLAAILSPIATKYTTIRFEMVSMIAAVLIIGLLALDGSIGLVDGIVLISLLIVFVYLVYRLKRNDAAGQEAYSKEVDEEDPSKISLPISILMIVVGLVVLYYGAKFFVDAAVDLATLLGVSDLLIGLLVVAVGSALPEMCICLVASYKGENELAVSNIVGSIVFNTFLALGIGAVVTDIPVSNALMLFHIPMMIAMTALLFLMVRYKNGISRPMGAVLFVIYVAYVAVMGLVPSLTI